jgi:hypothetical protein
MKYLNSLLIIPAMVIGGALGYCLAYVTVLGLIFAMSLVSGRAHAAPADKAKETKTAPQAADISQDLEKVANCWTEARPYRETWPASGDAAIILSNRCRAIQGDLDKRLGKTTFCTRIDNGTRFGGTKCEVTK